MLLPMLLASSPPSDPLSDQRTGASTRVDAAPTIELRTDDDWERFLGRPAAIPDTASPDTTSLVAPSTPALAANVRRGWTVVRTFLLVCADLLAANAAGAFARSARFDAASLPATVDSVDHQLNLTYAQLSTLMALAWVVALVCAGAYHKRRFASLWEQGGALLRGTVSLLALIGVSSLFARLQISRTFVVVGVAMLLVFTFIGRTLVYGLFQLLMRVGISTDRVLLIGPAPQVAEIRRHLERTSRRRVRVVSELHTTGLSEIPELRLANLDADGPARDNFGTTAIGSIIDVVTRRGLTSVILCGQTALPMGGLRRLSTLLSGSGVSLVVAPGTSEALAPSVQVHPIGDLMFLRVRDSKPGVLERTIKALIDVAGSIVMLLVLSPLILVVTIAVAREGRPILFRQTRMGKGGRPFTIMKFRTMVPDAEDRLHREGLYEQYVTNGYKLPAGSDPRITATGQFLRRTSLDELPQLFNVVRRQMSLVGPRPVLAEELPLYGAFLPAYVGVRPGVTGYWQINGRSDVGFPERAELDGYYYDHRSVRFDLRILARTFIAVAFRRGAH